jgi:hypothetical protein
MALQVAPCARSQPRSSDGRANAPLNPGLMVTPHRCHPLLVSRTLEQGFQRGPGVAAPLVRGGDGITRSLPFPTDQGAVVSGLADGHLLLIPDDTGDPGRTDGVLLDLLAAHPPGTCPLRADEVLREGHEAHPVCRCQFAIRQRETQVRASAPPTRSQQAHQNRRSRPGSGGRDVIQFSGTVGE